MANYETDSIDVGGEGPTLGLRAYGYFTPSLYLGASAHFHPLNMEDHSSTQLSSFDIQQKSFGPLIGILIGKRYQLWANYFFYDEADLTYDQGSASTSYEQTLKGEGFQLAASFWLWEFMTLKAAYSLHLYDEYEQSQPSSDSGDLSDDETIGILSFSAMFPINFL